MATFRAALEVPPEARRWTGHKPRPTLGLALLRQGERSSTGRLEAGCLPAALEVSPRARRR